MGTRFSCKISMRLILYGFKWQTKIDCLVSVLRKWEPLRSMALDLMEVIFPSKFTMFSYHPTFPPTSYLSLRYTTLGTVLLTHTMVENETIQTYISQIMLTSYLRTEKNQAMDFGKFIISLNPVCIPLHVSQTQTSTYGTCVLDISITEVPVISFKTLWNLARTLPLPASRASWENMNKRVTWALCIVLILLFAGYIVIFLDLSQSALVEDTSTVWFL